MSDEVRSRRAEYAELTRQAILESAAELFVDKGFTDTGIDEVGRAARVSKGAVYHHFDDKPGLFAAVFENHCTTALGQIQDTVSESMSPREQLQASISAMLGAYAGDRQLRELSRQAGFAIGEDRRREVQQTRSVPYVEGILTRAKDDGTLAPGIDVTVAARMVLELVFDGAVAFSEAPTKTGYRQTIEDALVAMVTGLLVDSK